MSSQTIIFPPWPLADDLCREQFYWVYWGLTERLPTSRSPPILLKNHTLFQIDERSKFQTKKD